MVFCKYTIGTRDSSLIMTIKKKKKLTVSISHNNFIQIIKVINFIY